MARAGGGITFVLSWTMLMVMTCQVVECNIRRSSQWSNVPIAKQSEIPNYNCTRNCAIENARGQRGFPNNMDVFVTCMGKCTEGNYIFNESYTASSCGKLPRHLLIANYKLESCPPVNVKVHELALPTGRDGTNEGHLLLAWQPCAALKTNISGYFFEMSPPSYIVFPCTYLGMSRHLTPDEQITFVALYPIKLTYRQNWLFFASDRDDRYRKVEYFPKDCWEINEDWSTEPCRCPRERWSQSETNITVSGYTVRFSSDQYPTCKDVSHYSFAILYQYRQRPRRYIYSKNFQQNILGKDQLVTKAFTGVYPVVDGVVVYAYVSVTTGINYLPKTIRTSYTFSDHRVKPWESPAPRITQLGNGTYEVSFEEAIPDFHIPAYSIRLNEHFTTGFNVSQENNATSAMVDSQGNITSSFNNIGSGLWSIQIKEIRSEYPRNVRYIRKLYGEEIFRDPVWGNHTYFRVLGDLETLEHGSGTSPP